MDCKIALLAFVVVVAVFLPSANAHKCYVCNSMDNNRNNPECSRTLNGIQPSECQKEFFSNLAEIQFPDVIRQVFTTTQNDHYQVPEWQCAKIVIADMNSNNQQNNYTIRTCLPKSDMTFCEKARQRLQNQRYNVDCNLCHGELCNGASSMSFSLLPILGIFALSSYILKA